MMTTGGAMLLPSFAVRIGEPSQSVAPQSKPCLRDADVQKWVMVH